MKNNENSQKKLFAFIIVFILLGSGAAYILAFGGIGKGTNFNGNADKLSFDKKVSELGINSADDLYSMFLCPCCNKPIDPRKPCCGMAKAMIEYINQLLANGLSYDAAAVKAAEKYGVNSVIESKRELIRGKLLNSNPEAFPGSKITFSESIGKAAPDFVLDSLSGNKVNLSSYKGKNVVLFFNEGSMCYPSCWNQISEFANDTRFLGNDVVVLSIEPDQKDEWVKIAEKVPKFSDANILFDNARGVSTAYDVLNLPSSMHKGTYPGHTYFIIDKDGKIRFTFDDPKMGINNDRIAEELKKL